MRGLRLPAAVAMALLALAACGRPARQPPSGDSGQAAATPAYSGYGTPPAPPSPPPPPDQLAAAQIVLEACRREAEVPNAPAVGPCMYDHGWVQKMTLDCSYGNKPNDAACYMPRGG